MWEININFSPKYGFIQGSNIYKMKVMASSPIISWETDGEIMETVTDFIFLGSKIAADGEGSHEIKIRLLLGKKLWHT